MKSVIAILQSVGFLTPRLLAARPNILRIVSEDSAWNRLCCYGRKDALFAEFAEVSGEYTELNLVCILTWIGAPEDIPNDWVKSTLKSKKSE